MKLASILYMNVPESRSTMGHPGQTNVAKEIKNFGYMKFRIFMVKASNIIDVGESIKGGRLHNLHILTRS